jgi:hypothetical protein
MAPTIPTELVAAALRMALQQRKPPLDCCCIQIGEASMPAWNIRLYPVSTAFAAA